MKVYVVVTGCYEQQGVAGVYSSPEAAMAAHPVSKIVTEPSDPAGGRCERPGGWQQSRDGEWDNGLDWDYAACIEVHDLDGI